MKNRSFGAGKIICFIGVLGIVIIGVFLYKEFLFKQEELQIEPVRVACIGDSLTFRRAYEGEKILNYSEYLTDLLGEGYTVKNFGEAGVCTRKDGNYPYTSLRVYRVGKEYEADILVVMIGTNDIWDYNWVDAERFKTEYLQLIDSYLETEKTPRIYLCTLPKLFDENGKTVEDGCGERLEIASNVIREVADEREYHLIDMNQITAQHPDWYSEDHIHFSNYGASKIAKVIAEELLEE